MSRFFILRFINQYFEPTTLWKQKLIPPAVVTRWHYKYKLLSEQQVIKVVAPVPWVRFSDQGRLDLENSSRRKGKALVVLHI